MSDRYDTSGNPEADFEPGSNGLVLANLLGVTNPAVMSEIELDLLIRLQDALVEEVAVDQVFSGADLCAWHHRWLGEVYAWAGKYRSLNLSKDGFPFAASAQIPRLMSLLERDILRRYTPCQGLREQQLAEAIATVHIELILIHPFREGNGRIARLLAILMALQAGWPSLDFSAWDANRDAYFEAVRAGLTDPGPMTRWVLPVLRASRVGNLP